MLPILTTGVLHGGRMFSTTGVFHGGGGLLPNRHAFWSSILFSLRVFLREVVVVGCSQLFGEVVGCSFGAWTDHWCRVTSTF